MNLSLSVYMSSCKDMLHTFNGIPVICIIGDAVQYQFIQLSVLIIAKAE